MANVPGKRIWKAVSVFGRSVYPCKSEMHVRAMDFEEAFKVVDVAVFAKTKRHLKDIEVAILRGSWQGRKYQEIAETYGYTPEYLKQDVGPKLWKLLSEALGEKLSKTNFQAALERHWRFSCTDANADTKVALPTLPLRPRLTRSQLDTVAQLQKSTAFYSEPKMQEITLVETLKTRVFLSYCSELPDLSFAQQLCADLEAAGKEVFMAGESVRLGANWPQRLDKELERCDYFVLLLSPQAAVSEMVTEKVRRASELRNSRQPNKPKILAIRVGYSMSSLLNHDLRGYLQGIQSYEWRSPADTPSVVQAVLNLLAEEGALVPSESTQALPTISATLTNINKRPLLVAEPELPVGPVPLDSSFYVERPPIESRCYQEILQPGALIQIKAPRQMGKTSLMARILYKAREHGYQTLPLSFQLADRAVFTNLDTFLRWFCESVGRRLKRLNQLDDYWTTYGSKDKTTAYFEECLLEQITSPLVVGLDQVERVFSHCDIADEFFSLLRTWYEYAKYGDRVSEIWKKLRVVMVHSSEDYIPLDINQSPFNVGLNVELHEFSPDQVQDLVGRHQGLNWTTTQVQKLMNMVGGHPYLVRLALYHIQHQDITLEQLLQTAPEEAGIYSDHLRRHLWNLKQHPELAAAFNHVLTAAAPVELDLELAFRLYSMGLVMHRHENHVTVRCDLYRQYFRNRVLVILRQLTRRIGTVDPELQERIRQLLIA